MAAGSISDILPGVLGALTTQPGTLRPDGDPLGLVERLGGARRAVVLLIDGLGFHTLPLARQAAPLIGDVLDGRLGSLTELSAGFPSTTPTSLVSLGTGALPGAHGVLGFRVVVPGTDRVLDHTHWKGDPDPAVWQPVRTRFERAGVSTAVFGPPEFEGTNLTSAAYRGAPYSGATLDTLADRILASDATLMYGYHPGVDRYGHLCGLGSPEWLAEVGDVDRMLARLIDGLPDDTALVLTADHGMLNADEDDKLDYDQLPQLRQGVRALAGEPRVRYVHTVPGAAEDVRAAWAETLGESALVMSRAEAIDTGWYGPVPAEHAERIGDVVAACLGQRVVVAREREPIPSLLVGYHGSVTAEEVAIPLLVVPAG